MSFYLSKKNYNSTYFFIGLILSLTLFFSPTAHASEAGDAVQRSYVAYYARPADPAGLDFWVGRLGDSNGDLQGIIDEFGNSQEYTDRFSGLSHPELVNNIYQNLYNRDADEAGLAYYENLLETGDSTLAKIALNILDGSQNSDAAIIQNKLTVANYYTDELRTNSANYNLSGIVDLLSQVTEVATSVNTVQNQISSQLLSTRAARSCRESDANGENSGLNCFASDSELEIYIREMMLAKYGEVREPYPEILFAEGDASATDSAATPRVSTTNTQESEVDEADRIKTDGQYIYTAELNGSNVNIFQPDSGSTSLVKKLALNSVEHSNIAGLYLASEQNKLVALTEDGLNVYPLWDMWFVPSYWQERKTEVHTVDISNPGGASQTSRLTLDGQLINSRRIGSTLYVATRHTPTLDGLIEYPTTEAEVVKNRTLINAADLDDFLPHYQLDQQDQGALFSADDCLITTDNNSVHDQVSIVSMLAVDLSGVTPVPHGRCFTGDVETLYASPEAVYLATTDYNYTTDEAGWAVYSGVTETDIHKFALDGIEISYRGSGTVQGHLGWQQDLKPFRMSEHNGVLRVITYTGDQPSTLASPAKLSILEENTGSESLEVLATLPNNNRPAALGKPGEQIYGVRFQGERGYLVTFRVTDPLYVLDLSNPNDPFIASELEINGYSDYLHPVGDNFLLGVGKDAIPDTSVGDGRGAWYQGVKLSLIDVSDAEAPVEKQQIIIGKRGTNTAVSSSHHALTTLLEGNILRAALPVSVHETPYSNSGFDYTNNPSASYAWTRDELYRLNIDTTTGELETLPAVAGEQSGGADFGYSYAWAEDRSVMIGDYVYYLHGDQLTGQVW